MGKVTALFLDTITDKSGHQMVGMAVSVCLTPAAPSPLPIPYPTFGNVLEGLIDPCMRTKIEGAKILTVGGCMKRCHGNGPGTLKEVVSPEHHRAYISSGSRAKWSVCRHTRTDMKPPPRCGPISREPATGYCRSRGARLPR